MLSGSGDVCCAGVCVANAKSPAECRAGAVALFQFREWGGVGAPTWLLLAVSFAENNALVRRLPYIV